MKRLAASACVALLIVACSANNGGPTDSGASFDALADVAQRDAGSDAARADAAEGGAFDAIADATPEAAPVDALADGEMDATVADAGSDGAAFDASDAPADTPADTGKTVDAAADAVAAPTFTELYNEMFATCGSCHTSVHSSSLDLSSKGAAYVGLVGTPASPSGSCANSGLTRVVAGNAAISLLHQKLAGTQPCGSSMPPGITLSASERGRVAAWISAGAKND